MADRRFAGWVRGCGGVLVGAVTTVKPGVGGGVGVGVGVVIVVVWIVGGGAEGGLVAGADVAGVLGAGVLAAGVLVVGVCVDGAERGCACTLLAPLLVPACSRRPPPVSFPWGCPVGLAFL